MPPAELRLGLSGRALAFPEGRPFCLVCGAPPFGRRTLPCRDGDYARRASRDLNSILEWLNPALAYLNWRRKASFSIDAPLCFRHFWRGLLGEFLVIGAFVAALAALAVLWAKGRLPAGPSGTGALLKAGLVAIFLVGGWLLSRAGPGRPVLPCLVKREAETRVLLVYPDGLPTAR
ncbi:MAG TPA: hypothetical protein VKW77_07280 [Acidimicrobiales bacterium]|nr:hypothetical protein [Acidimicrobiales bacterium]